MTVPNGETASGTSGESQPASQPSPLQTPPPAAQPQTSNSGNSAPDWSHELKTTLEALPERIVNSLREALTPPKTTGSQSQRPAETAETQSGTNSGAAPAGASTGQQGTEHQPGKKKASVTFFGIPWA